MSRAQFKWIFWVFIALLPGIGRPTIAQFPIHTPSRPNSFPLIRPVEEGTVVAWGASDQLQSIVPSGLKRVVSIAAGRSHTVALRSDGTVVAWGDNSYGQTNVPSGLKDVVAISAGQGHTVALKSDGTIVAWGWNQFGQAANDNTEIVAISAGLQHTAFLRRDGIVLVNGANGVNQRDVPSGLKNVVAVAAGESSTVALKEDGTVVAWGDAGWAERLLPANLDGVTALSVYGHVLALKSDGGVVAWGLNGNVYGQLTIAADLTNVVSVAAGRRHSVALKSDGTVSAWGMNDSKQATVPEGLHDVIAIAAGDAHTVCLIKTPTQPKRATAAVQVVNGFVVGVLVVDGGFGYATPPSVQISGDAGEGAVLQAVVADGRVISIEVLDAGRGYTGTISVMIEPPPIPAPPTLSISVSRVAVTMNLTKGYFYQLESSDDLVNWVTSGPRFLAEDEKTVQEFVVGEAGKFFRVNQVP